MEHYGRFGVVMFIAFGVDEFVYRKRLGGNVQDSDSDDRYNEDERHDNWLKMCYFNQLSYFINAQKVSKNVQNFYEAGNH